MGLGSAVWPCGLCGGCGKEGRAIPGCLLPTAGCVWMGLPGHDTLTFRDKPEP